MKEKNVKPEKTYEKVVEYIREEIWRGNLKRGERLPPERDLAELLGVSRNSVREALRTMSLMGFVSSVQGAGNFVSCDLEKNLSETFRMMMLLGETNYMQVSQLRRGLEGETARLAALRVTSKQLVKFDEIVAHMQEETDNARAAKLDQQFHALLVETAGNKLIHALFSAMITTVNEFIATMYVRIFDSEHTGSLLLAAHKSIVEALRAHDEQAALHAIWKHFEIVDSAISHM
ncbi:MAG: FadR family transcriptional regulator [Clostridia bacterium]|nr:FadR family transcriptional regulator [Clostridia bacterium]